VSLAQPAALPGWGVQHADERVFAAWVGGLPVSTVWRQKQLARQRAFVARWPRLDDWFVAPLPVRVGRLHGQDPTQAIDVVSFEARPYLCYLALHHGLRLDWPYLTAAATLRLPRCVDPVVVDAVEALVADAVQLGYAQISARHTFWPLLGRLLLAAGHGELSRLCEVDLDGYRAALVEFGKRDDIALFYGSAEAFTGRATQLRAHLHRLAVMLYHRGQLAEAPQRILPSYAQRPVGPAAMEQVVMRYVGARRLDARPSTVAKLELGCVGSWASWPTTPWPSATGGR
jgi:hypothetical protein